MKLEDIQDEWQKEDWLSTEHGFIETETNSDTPLSGLTWTANQVSYLRVRRKSLVDIGNRYGDLLSSMATDAMLVESASLVQTEKSCIPVLYMITVSHLC